MDSMKKILQNITKYYNIKKQRQNNILPLFFIFTVIPGYFVSTATPGSSLPSIHSRNAPPAVEM